MAEGFVKGMGNLKWQGTNKRVKRCNEQTIPACEPDSLCDVDIVFIFDKNFRNEPGVFDFKEKVQVITRWLVKFTRSYRLGLVEFDYTSSSVSLVMSLNNSGAFETAVDDIVLGSGSAEIIVYRNSDEALQRVIDQETGTWRSQAEKLVILVSQGLPHGGDLSVDTIDLTAQIAKVDTLSGVPVTVSTIAVPYYLADDTGNVPVFVSGLENHLELLAGPSHGNGVFRSVQTNGPDDNNETENVLVEAMMHSIGTLCTEGENTTATAGCCAVIPCDICLKWTVDKYPEDPYIVEGVMTWAGDRWIGGVDGMEVEAYWDLRRHCIFFLEVDGVILFSATRCTQYNAEGEVIDPDAPLVGCRAPEGETVVERLVSYDETVVGILSWEVPIEYELPRRKAQQPQPCNWDIVFVIDNSDHNQFNTQQLLSSNIQPVVDWVEGVADSTQWGLIVFDATSATTVYGMNSDSAGFVTALNGIDPGDRLAVIEHDSDRRSDLAIGLAVGFTQWRSNAQKRIVFIAQGYPDDPLQLLDQYNHGTTALNNDIRIHSAACWFTVPTGESSAFYDTTENHTRYLALTTAGKYFEANPINATPPTIPTQILTSLQSSEQCDTDGRCAENFCGNCDCIPDELCVEIDNCRGILPFEGTFCDGMATSLKWVGNVIGLGCEYGVEINMYRASEDGQDYETGIEWLEGACLMQIDLTSYEKDFSFLLPVTCPELALTIEFETEPEIFSTLNIRRKHCEDCKPTSACPCCPNWPETASGNVTYTTSPVDDNDCNAASEVTVVPGDFGCNEGDIFDTIIYTSSDILWTRIYCIPQVGGESIWKVECKSDYYGGVWTEVLFDYICPACSGSGLAYGSFDYIGFMNCETSGGTEAIPMVIHADITIEC